MAVPEDPRRRLAASGPILLWGSTVLLAAVASAAGGLPAAPPLPTAAAKWQSAMSEAQEARQAGDFGRALSAYEEAADLAAKLADDARRAQALEGAAYVHDYDLRKDLDALPYWESAWELRRASGTTEDGIPTRVALRTIYHHLQLWEKIEPLAREALRLAEKDGEPGATIPALLSLARILESARPGNPETDELYRRALEAAEAAGRGAEVYSSVAAYLAGHRRWSEAIDLLQRAIEVQSAREPRDLVTLASYRKRLAGAYRGERLPELAAYELREALTLEEERFGPAHYKLVDTLRSLADLLAGAERHADAVEPLRRATAIAERTWGGEAATVRDLRRSLAAVERWAAGEGEEPPGKLTAGCRCQCSSHPDLDKLREEGRWHRAVELAEKAVAAAETKHGPASLEMADALDALGSLYWTLDPAAAAAARERRLEILRAELGIADPRVAEEAMDLAFLTSALNDGERALEYHRQRIESLEAAGRFGTGLARAFADLAHAQRRFGDAAGAVESRALALEVWRAVLAAGAPEVIEARTALAQAQVGAGDFGAAEASLLELVAELEADVSDSRWARGQLDAALSTLERIFRKTGRQEASEQIRERRMARRAR